MRRKTIIGLLSFLPFVLAAPVQAEFWAISANNVVVEVNENVDPPKYMLQGYTFQGYGDLGVPDHNIPLDALVLGQSTGVANVGAPPEFVIENNDDFDLNSFVPRNGADPPEIQVRNFGGSETWQDTNGEDKFDFFIWEVGANDQFAVRPILPGDVLGEPVVVPGSKFKDTGGEPLPDLRRAGAYNTGQQIGGIAFKVTDLLDENGNALTNDAVILGLEFSSPGIDIAGVHAILGSSLASEPSPADGGVTSSVCPVLHWKAGANAVSQKVYLSNTFDDVSGMAESALIGTTAETSLDVCAQAYPGGLLGGVYYWRVVTTDDQQTEHPGAVWTFTVATSKAFGPTPVDQSLFVNPDVTLMWTPGTNAIEHIVIIDTNPDTVAAATDGVKATVPSYTPAPLQQGVTYYWRVDENDGTQTVKGSIWSFATVPAGTGGLVADYYAATDLSGDPVVSRVDTEINFDWSETSPDPGLELENYSVRWRGELIIPVEDSYDIIANSSDGVRVYLNDEMIIDDWSQHVPRDAEATLNLEEGTYPIVVEYFQGMPDATGAGAASIRLDWASPRITRQVIPSVQLVPQAKTLPVWPATDAMDVSQNPRLIWVPVDFEQPEHDVYLGNDLNAVAEATTATTGIYQGRTNDATYDMEGLEFGKTYHWRVDAIVNGQVIKGRVLSFTTASFLVIDDMESYTDKESQEIFMTWVDGYGGNGTGSTAGFLDPPYAESTIVNSGRQSLPIYFDNNGNFQIYDGLTTNPLYSEAVREFAVAQDWTMVDGIKAGTLALSYHGRGPVGSFAYDTNTDRYTIEAQGRGIIDFDDVFRFAYTKVTGDVEAKARLISYTRYQADPRYPDSDPDETVMGIMIRETLEPNSPMAFIGLRMAGQASFRWRKVAGEWLELQNAPSSPATLALPQWFRLTRQGNKFTAEYSVDAQTWEPVGDPVTISIPSQVYIGLVHTAGVSDDDPRSTASVWSGLSIAESVDPPLPLANVIDIGMEARMNPDEKFYVAVEDADGNVAVMNNPNDPKSLQLNEWQEWEIAVGDITAQGVDLSKVKKLYIGAGDRDNPTSGEEGSFFIDDIRLHTVRTIELAPIDSLEVTGDYGEVISINGIPKEDLILGTTTFSGPAPYDHSPAEDADNFELSINASCDGLDYVQTVFDVPVSTIFLLEKGGNDNGNVTALDANGNPLGAAASFEKTIFFKTGVQMRNQEGGGMMIEAVEPIYGIRITPLEEGGTLGIDPVSVSAIPAE